MDSNIINIGDKIDIRVLQQTEKEKATGIMPKVYKSRIQDIKQDGLLEISMPMYKGRMVLLSAGIRYQCVFYTKLGLYRCSVQVKEQYKVGKMYMLLMEPKSPIEKFQRREYFRFECAMDMEYCKITEEEAELDEVEAIKKHHKNLFPESKMLPGIAVDLSGGGIRFVAEEEGERGEFLLLSIILESVDVSHLLEVAGQVLSCKKIENKSAKKSEAEKYEYRVQFLTRDQRKREIIIKYIFEQERKNRQKG